VSGARSSTSGATYAGVPATRAPPASPMPSAAMPKSNTRVPVGVSMTLPGLTSRWTTPSRCAAASAPATSAQTWTASRHGSAPARSRLARVSPSSSSMTRYGTTTPPAILTSPKSKTWATLGCAIRATARASRRVNDRRTGSAASGAARTFTATARPSTSSAARHTCDIPPEPSGRSRTYRCPSRSPTANCEGDGVTTPVKHGVAGHARPVHPAALAAAIHAGLRYGKAPPRT